MTLTKQWMREAWLPQLKFEMEDVFDIRSYLSLKSTNILSTSVENRNINVKCFGPIGFKDTPRISNISYYNILHHVAQEARLLVTILSGGVVLNPRAEKAPDDPLARSNKITP
jgi:hypothetical protein